MHNKANNGAQVAPTTTSEPAKAESPQAQPKSLFQRYAIRSTFNIPEAPEKAEIQGMAPGLYGVPRIDPFYVFETERLRDLTMFWVGGFTFCVIEGDPSAGKSSLFEQWHARLNVPLYKISCGPTTENYHLIGQYLPTSEGSLKWHDGPVTRACREGSSVLLDEYNNLDPAEATALNLVLEGYSFMIPQTGEIIQPAPTTRIFGTQNSVDSLAAVAGRNVMDVANEDRCFYMEVDYLRPDLETALVIRNLVAGGVSTALSETIASMTVAVANKVRRAFREGADGIEKPISTRAVLRWAKLTAMYQPVLSKQARSGIHYALRRALKMPVTMASAVNEMITLVAGYDENCRSKVGP